MGPLVLLLTLCALPVPAGETLVYLSEGQHAGSVRVEGLVGGLAQKLIDAKLSSAQWAEIFPVWLGDPPRQNIPPMLGDRYAQGDGLMFHPRFPFLEGRAHLARFDLARALVSLGLRPEGAVIELHFTPERPERAKPEVLAVFPSADQVPANLLRFYVHFSQPMAREQAYSGLRILDEQGQPVAQPFVIVPQELWDPKSTRLTVLFDPGRIKRQVGPNIELGPPLLPGRSYTLEIRDRSDSAGVPMEQVYRKSFQTLDDDRSPPDPDHWRISQPRHQSRDPLTVTFDAPLDAALAERCLQVRQGKTKVEGRVQLGAEQRSWQFTPSQAWGGGNYILDISASLEDPSGNRLNHLFDLPMDQANGQVHGRQLSFTAKGPTE